MKLTFAKAEHLKRNATTAQDPKAVFQAMRPVFNDLQTELQRSLGFFTNLDRTRRSAAWWPWATPSSCPGCGATWPRAWASRSSGWRPSAAWSARRSWPPRLQGQHPLLRRLLRAGAAGAGQGRAADEPAAQGIHRDRLIRGKKPWAVAAAAAVLLACSLSFAAYSASLGSVSSEGYWGDAEIEAKAVTKRAADFKHDCDECRGAITWPSSRSATTW